MPRVFRIRTWPLLRPAETLSKTAENRRYVVTTAYDLTTDLREMKQKNDLLEALNRRRLVTPLLLHPEDEGLAAALTYDSLVTERHRL